MDLQEYQDGLSRQIDAVYLANPEMRDRRKYLPGMTNGLGNPFAAIWFLDEYPSLGWLEQ